MSTLHPHDLLPNGIDELSPPDSWALDTLRRRVLDYYRSYGYDLVHPPIIEYLEPLLVGMGRDLDLQTFKLIDQSNGRTLGIRADMTPQVARMDAFNNHPDPVRLCYIGTVLHARGDQGGTRNPLQLGAEIYGHSGIESDMEILTLMLETLALAGMTSIHLDIGHVQIFRTLATRADLSDDQATELFQLLQKKSKPDIAQYMKTLTCDTQIKQKLHALVDLTGDATILDEAYRVLAQGDPEIRATLDYLVQLAALIGARFASTPVHFDLSELRGYHYHTGVVFTAYHAKQQIKDVARGGRYDGLCKAADGTWRPATGFSTDLKALILDSPLQPELPDAIFVPLAAQKKYPDALNALRASGKRVIYELKGQRASASDMGCDWTIDSQPDTLQLIRVIS